MFIWSSFLNVLFDLSAENIAEKHSFSVSTYIKRIKSVKDLAIGKKKICSKLLQSQLITNFPMKILNQAGN